MIAVLVAVTILLGIALSKQSLERWQGFSEATHFSQLIDREIGAISSGKSGSKGTSLLSWCAYLYYLIWPLSSLCTWSGLEKGQDPFRAFSLKKWAIMGWASRYLLIRPMTRLLNIGCLKVDGSCIKPLTKVVYAVDWSGLVTRLSAASNQSTYCLKDSWESVATLKRLSVYFGSYILNSWTCDNWADTSAKEVTLPKGTCWNHVSDPSSKLVGNTLNIRASSCW